MIDWLKLKNEYINGNISYRKLAEKYDVSFNTLKDRAKKEKWFDERKKQHNEITTKSQQKTAYFR
ncbi:MAG: helix-turn-helix domain-containing protein [Ruminococcus sp.]|nr:helix-turn-helix domain-containing protein [Ruminococcus sp.]